MNFQRVIFSLPTSQIFLQRFFENPFWFWQTSVSFTTSSNLCRFSSHLHFDCSHSHVTWLWWVISSYLYTSCDGVSCLQPYAVGTCDWPILWRFGSIFCVQQHRCTHIVGRVGLQFFSFNLFYGLSLNTSLRIFLASPATATFQHGILTQLACDESTVTLLRSLQYGSKFGLRTLFAHQDQSRGRVLVQLYSGNVVFLGPPSLEEYQMHRVQRFNFQGRIYTYVNYTQQFSSEPMRQLSMSLPMTNLSNHRFD